MRFVRTIAKHTRKEMRGLRTLDEEHDLMENTLGAMLLMGMTVGGALTAGLFVIIRLIF